MRRRRVARRRSGQSLTEYAIILFLIAVGCVGVVGLFGNNLRSLFAASAGSLAGNRALENGGSKTPSGLTKWSLKGGENGKGFNAGGTLNKRHTGGGTGAPED